MNGVEPLPPRLLERCQNWQRTAYREDQERRRQLAAEGQAPSAMVIACCDSRLPATALFGSGPGEVFVHRNIANLAPPYTQEGCQGTAAAVDYAVATLGVRHLLVLGHSQCGGVSGCIARCAGQAPQLEDAANPVGRWLAALRPAFDRISSLPAAQQQTALEKMGVQLSLENLLGYPAVAKAVAAERLSLHGLWLEIGEGRLEVYDGASGGFRGMLG